MDEAQPAQAPEPEHGADERQDATITASRSEPWRTERDWVASCRAILQESSGGGKGGLETPITPRFHVEPWRVATWDSGSAIR